VRAGRLAAAAFWLACAAAARAEEPASRSDSIHQLEGEWKDSEDRSVTLASLRGKVLVATMAYTTCETVCPMIFADLQRIERALTPAARERVWFVVFSLDPERDTPGRMREFRKERGFESPQWIFLSAPEERVREMSAVLGVQYRRAAEGEVAHTSVLAVVDADGVIRHEQPGVGKDPSPLVVVVEGLVSPRSGATKPAP
jgi:protein SCO1/2